MKLAIMSDFHLGFGERTPRQRESYENATRALEIALDEKVDAILIAGDLFNSAVPTQEVLFRAFELLSTARKGKSKVRVRKIYRDGKEKEISFFGIPLIAIHGTHEFRGKDYKNVLELMESAGFLIYLHSSIALIEKGKERIAVHGFSGVPEKKALDALRLWNPKPMKGCKSILMLHQSIKEYLPFDDEMIATISLSDLQMEFDLVVDGHLHWRNEENLGDSNLLIPGSTIITQMKKSESGREKGVYLLDSEKNELNFLPLPRQRKLFYHKIQVENASIEEVKEKIEKEIEKGLGSMAELIPLIRLLLVGTLAKGVSVSDIDFNELEQKFKDRAILSIDTKFQTISFKKKIAELRELQKSKKSISSIGLDILEKNLKETAFENAFDVKRVFDLLAENRVEEVMKIIAEKKELEVLH